MALSIIRAAVHEVEYPGLESALFNDGEKWFTGSRDSLEQSGLVPLGTLFPGEVPGKRGGRWRDAAGRLPE